jgi:hypothetical protein
MYPLSEAELMVARLEHERLTKRARQLASLDVPERRWLRLPAWLPRMTALWRRRRADPAPPVPSRRTRRHRTGWTAVHGAAPSDTAQRLHRARRHEPMPHHRAVRRRRLADP